MKRLLTVLLSLSLAAGVASSVRAADKPAPAVPPPPKSGTSAFAAAIDSIQILEKAVAKDSSRFDDLYRLGVMYLDRDRVAEATRVLGKAHELRPKDHKVLVNLGAALDAGGKADEAQKYYRQALDLAPTDSVASCRLASSLYAQSKYSESMGLLRQVIQQSPRAYCAYFTLGVAFADAGIYKEAIKMWRKVVDLAPTSPEAVSARESIDVLEKFVQQ